MDEAEKYQQRLQAIAEKRRLQEEQERARRDMEDERLRLQQLKRKSLRDQWLMEAPPLSPSSMDGQAPRSPLWGAQAQEIEQRIDQLQTESQRLAEEEEKLTEQMEDGQTDAAAVAAAVAESVADSSPGPVVENGQPQESVAEVVAEEAAESPSPPSEDATAAALTNGRGEGEREAAPQGEDGRPGANGEAAAALDAADGPVTLTLLGFSEAEPDRLPVNGEEEEEEEEEEEGAVVMRAERVIITDEGEEVAAAAVVDDDELPAQGGEAGDSGAPQPRCPSPDRGEEEEEEEAGEAEGADPEAVPEASAAGPDGEVDEEKDVEEEKGEEEEEAEKEEEKEGVVAAETPTGEARGEGEAAGEGEGGTDEEAAPETEVRAATPDPQSPARPAAAEALDAVPVYSEVPLSLAPAADGEAAQPAAAESHGDPGSEAAPEAPAEAPLPGQEFQEVSLAEPRTETAASAEQEPLLSPSKDPEAQAGARAEEAAPLEETLAPARGQGGDAPKRKTCQCCSVM